MKFHERRMQGGKRFNRFFKPHVFALDFYEELILMADTKEKRSSRQITGAPSFDYQRFSVVNLWAK
jgi:hypothetical protein